jgi:uncharacterized protein YbjT (DUF2867 family)
MRAVIAGASGLVGSHILPLLLAEPAYGEVIALVRRPLAVQHSKLEQRVVDFSELTEENVAGADKVFSALGTTAANAGTKEKQRTVDYVYPLELGRVCRAAGARNYLLVSAAGVSAGSRVFYSRLKGELERDLEGLEYPALTIARPSLILGERAEQRWAEGLSKAVMPWAVDPLLRGGWRRYHSIAAEMIARALVARSLADFSGVEILEYDGMMAAARTWAR